ncbi:hypothetical protein DVR12_15080 [Chitinophaga silvatica]|uniref:Uncharacterized protein n=1 Tax=Chitinophaga silvatica TaxID=2282649 RepID=A0A3E1Y989_9BACT|nr:hypothetical protein [Chitinophaga silvatica]RFS21967.1 hypothetical protein DVR12_15080 [Chitinophaga silvatica]
MRLNCLIIIVTAITEFLSPEPVRAQQNPSFGTTYQQLSRFIDTALIPMKAGSNSLAFSLKAEIDNGGTIVKLECSTNVAGDMKPRLFRMKDLDIKWNKFTGKTGKYYVIIPVYFIVEHASGKILLNSKTEFTNGFYFDDGDLFDNKALNNYYFLKPIYLQRYF